MSPASGTSRPPASWNAHPSSIRRVSVRRGSKRRAAG
jgi:hypothetical protein